EDLGLHDQECAGAYAQDEDRSRCAGDGRRARFDARARAPAKAVRREEEEVKTLIEMPKDPVALYVLAHGAGAGMTHPFMADIAKRLLAKRIGTLRYEFPYMEEKKGRPDVPAVAEARVREAVQAAAKEAPGVKLIAGGKSFGGRMTSQAAA